MKMPPLRFKAVCTETGRESKPVQLGEKVGGAFRNHVICVLMSDKFEMPRSDKNSEICQSTGMTDSRGQEVYEGACLWWSSMRPGIWIVVEYFNGEYRGRLSDSGIWIQFTLKEMLDKGMVVIGNRWMPADELKARAEAIQSKQNQ